MQITRSKKDDKIEYLVDGQVPLTVEVRKKGCILQCQFIGAVTGNIVPHLIEDGTEWVTKNSEVELDLSLVYHISAAGIDALLNLSMLAGDNNHSLRCAYVSQAVSDQIHDIKFLSQLLDWNREIKVDKRLDDLCRNARISQAEVRTNSEKTEDNTQEPDNSPSEDTEPSVSHAVESNKGNEVSAQSETNAGEEGAQTHTEEKQQETQTPDSLPETTELTIPDELETRELSMSELEEDDLPRTRELNNISSAPIIIRISNGQVITGQSVKTTIGRAETCDVCIDDNDAISRRHAHIIRIEGKNYVVADQSAKNQTIVNTDEILPGEKLEFGEYAFVCLADELLLVAFGKAAQKLVADGQIAYLRCMDTGELLLLDKTPVMLGRRYPWKKESMSFDGIGRDHAKMICEDGSWKVEDLTSRNGTRINRVRLQPNTLHAICSDDSLYLANKQYLFRIVQLVKEA